MLKVAIVGRANTGKTTIFNKILRKKASITHDSPGVTIDYKESIVKQKDFNFMLIDTAGFEGFKTRDDIKTKAFKKSLSVIENADLCMLVIDARDGIQEQDIMIYDVLKKANKKILIIFNKTENKSKINLDTIHSFSDKELKEAIFTSAEHNQGLREILNFIVKTQKDYEDNFSNDEKTIISLENNKENSFNLAIVGQPNVGKSTIVNNILKEERVITDKKSGTTRDSISIPTKYKNYTINIIDTAGIRRKLTKDEEIESMSVKESFKAIDFAHIVALIMDITKPLESQDKSLMERIILEGRPVIIIFNKSDLIKEKDTKELIKDFNSQLKHDYFQKISVFFTMSAIKNNETNDLLDEAIKQYEKWNTKIKTSVLNEWLNTQFLLSHQPPKIKNKTLKIKFISQHSTRPPTFKISSNFIDIPENYIQYIRNSIAKDFQIENIPIRIISKKASNPFSKTTAKQKKYKR